MKPPTSRCLLLSVLVGLVSIPTAATPALSNGAISAEFGDRGLVAITDVASKHVFRFGRDDFALVLSGNHLDSASLTKPTRRAGPDSISYTWTAGAFRLDVVYEVKPGWRFVSKQIVVTSLPGSVFTIDEVVVFRTATIETVRDMLVHAPGRASLGVGGHGACLRFDGPAGLLALAQNPFLDLSRQGDTFVVRYEPKMEWAADNGPFAADRGILAPYRLSGRQLPPQMLPEWQMGTVASGGGMDEAEVAAFTEVVRAFLLYRPVTPLNLFVGWCVNDYQIDIATPEGRVEYRRILDRASELGADHVLFAPTNSDLGRREDSVDDWSWENLLWLGLGQRIRRNEWSPTGGVIPPSVGEMIDYARSKRLSLLAYVYPVVAFSQDPSWLVTRRNAPAGARKYASLGSRRLQDWLLETLVAFRARTGISGYSFDHTFLGFDGSTSYAQWWGWRRVMETLRQRVPDIVIDGRQAYHLYGPWGWLAGSYPHPTYNDEQPESFVPFPDLSFDRVSAAHQRFTAYRFRNYDFAPSEIVPGFITHQTGRNDDTGEMPATKTDKGVMLNRFRPRDWDYLGWRYSLLSSIATAGWNNVLNMIPARDIAEYEHFAEADKAWFRRWLDWTEASKEYLRHTRTILGQPAIGKADGTAAIVDNRGFLFLFNPNARRVTATISLDTSIGLKKVALSLLVREMYPLEGRLVGKPGAGSWSFGDTLSLELDGQSATVLEIGPAGPATTPLLFGAPGSASLAAGVLSLDDVRGEMGTRAELLVRLPAGQSAQTVRVNGRELPFTAPSPGLVVVDARFDGVLFRRAQPVTGYDPAFAGGTVTGTFTVPSRILDQLARRQAAWPIPWTPEDFRATWLAPHRLLLYVQLAEPDDRWEPRLCIDGRAVELKKAYSAIWAARRTFVGFYADLSVIAADRRHTVELELPPLRPGQFQGIFFHNVETEYTGAIAR